MKSTNLMGNARLERIVDNYPTAWLTHLELRGKVSVSGDLRQAAVRPGHKRVRGFSRLHGSIASAGRTWLHPFNS
jgi:hypothetical protein